jgi:putative endonuclease
VSDGQRRRRKQADEGFGRAAEARAAAALAEDGWTLLGQRVRTGVGEIDLVVARAGLLAFVEVKARPTLADAAASLGPRQQGRLARAAEAWLAAHPDVDTGAGIRFDVVLVDRDGRVRRIADAFRP